jgi:hypothetical protein
MTYADLLLAEWGIETRSLAVRTCMRRVLGELATETLLVLRRNPKLQVAVLPEAVFSVWAYFPAHRKRRIVRHLNIELKPTARVLLVIGEKQIDQQAAKIDRCRAQRPSWPCVALPAQP